MHNAANALDARGGVKAQDDRGLLLPPHPENANPIRGSAWHPPPSWNHQIPNSPGFLSGGEFSQRSPPLPGIQRQLIGLSGPPASSSGNLVGVQSAPSGASSSNYAGVGMNSNSTTVSSNNGSNGVEEFRAQKSETITQDVILIPTQLGMTLQGSTSNMSDASWITDNFEESFCNFAKCCPQYADFSMKNWQTGGEISGSACGAETPTHLVRIGVQSNSSVPFHFYVALLRLRNTNNQLALSVTSLDQPGLSFNSIVDDGAYEEIRKEYGLYRVSLMELGDYVSQLLTGETRHTLVCCGDTLRVIEETRQRRLCVLAFRNASNPRLQLEAIICSSHNRTYMAKTLLNYLCWWKRRVSEMEEELASKSEIISKLENELTRLECDRHEEHKLIKEAQHRKDVEMRELQMDNTKVIEELKLAKDKESQLEQSILEGREKIQDLLEMNRRISRDKEGLEAHNRELTREQTELKRQVSNLCENLSKYENTQNNLSTLRAENSELLERIRMSEDETRRLKQTYEDMKIKYNDSKHLENEVKMYKEEASKANEAKKCEGAALKEIVDDQKKLIEKLKNDEKLSHDTIADLQQKLEQERLELRRLNLHFAKRLSQNVIARTNPRSSL